MPKSVVTLGTFDGVHRGHQRILSKVVARAKALQGQSSALVFTMPPRHAETPRQKPVLLTTFTEKKALLQRLGIRKIRALIFNRQTANTTAEDFFRKIVLQRCQAQEMIVGPRVAFGKGRAGRLKQLREYGAASGVGIDVVLPVKVGAQSVSSRKIRALLEKGDIRRAESMLGRPYSAEGNVIHGDHRGRKLGFPTANLSIAPDKILPLGVYWVCVTEASAPLPLSRRELRSAWKGLCNVGTRPTFKGSRTRHCEVFLLQSGIKSLYGKRLRVVFLQKIRAEKRFSNAEALKKQITQDLVHAKRFKL